MIGSGSSSLNLREGAVPIGEKIRNLNWGFMALICVVAGIGYLALYSAGGGQASPWAERHLLRFAFTALIMIVIALFDIRFWAALAYPAYFGALALLLMVELVGDVGMGAQRWIDLGVIRLQPSEMMKIGVIMALARYYHSRSFEEARRWFTLLVPFAIIATPVALVLKQPDLGTALMICAGGFAIIFLTGIRWWKLIAGAALAGISIPIIWQFLHDYQKKRVLTFLDPETDPLGAGYHIMQSKIALGSGGIGGKGFLEGTQSHLNFLPEKQTDFIFTLWAEEWGLTGGLFLLFVFGLIFLYGFLIAFRARHQFGRLLAMGLMINFALYVFINIAMVMGLMPVVGVPLPLISYGGTAMLTAMISFGLIMSVYIHRDVKIPRFF